MQLGGCEGTVGSLGAAQGWSLGSPVRCAVELGRASGGVMIRTRHWPSPLVVTADIRSSLSPLNPEDD